MSHRDPLEPASRGLWTGGSVMLMLLAAALVAACSSPVAAQLPAGGAAPAPAPMITRSLTLEYIIVVVMIGGAVFAVCRSSRRN